MAVDAAKLTRQRLIALKVEVTTGTAESLTNAEAVYNAFDPAMKPDVGYSERQGQSALSRLSGVSGVRKGTFTFKSELFASGSGGAPTPTWATPLLTACGMKVASNAFTPDTGSSSYATITAGLYQDGRLKTISGATGNFTLSGETGKPAMFDWTFQGVWQPPTDTALLTPTYPTIIPPKVASATFTIGGTTYKIPKFELAANNDIQFREDITKASGLFATVICDRRFVIKVSPESLALASHDFFSDMLAGTTAAVNIVIGSGADNIITINAPVAQLMEAPQDDDRNGIMADSLTFLCARNAAAGDDEVSITFS